MRGCETQAARPLCAATFMLAWGLGAASFAATQPDFLTLPHGAKASIAVLANDAGTWDPASVFIASPPAAGSATPLADGRILYVHTDGLPAGDAFTYRAVDADSVTSAPEQVTLTFSDAPRFAATTVAMPPQPPGTNYAIVDAFPGLTFSVPTSMDVAPGETNRLFVLERGGRIQAVTNVGTANPGKMLFLDLSAAVYSDNELGLKGMAFHPGFATNGLFFVTYCTTQGTIRLSRFQRSLSDPNAADPASELVLIDQTNSGTIHNIDEATFGPDGYLYVGIGDEGFAGDPTTNTQTITKNFWSCILRIDPDKRPGNLEPNPHPAVPTNALGLAYYSIPADNPFVGATQFNGAAVSPAQVRTEFYAVGFRNPWQFSFDPLTGELWVGDVGHTLREEVDVMPAGGNGGWAFVEGDIPGPRTPPPGFSPVVPVWTYPHGGGAYEGSAIAGGLVVRGGVYPELEGKYLCSDIIAGNLWTIERAAGTTLVQRIGGQQTLVAFGRDPSNGQILMVDHGMGVLRRLLPGGPATPFPSTLSACGIFADLGDLSPNPGVMPYELNLPFWSDYAIKRRWFALTNLTDTFGFTRESAWATPAGAVWIKHFDLDLDRGNPATRKRIETRVLVRTTNGIYGVSYRWNEAGTEAALVPDAGVAFPLAVTNAGVPATQQWQIPTRAQCIFCHGQGGAFALGFGARQLNRTGTLAGVTGNFIDRLASAGYLTNAVDPAVTLPRHVRPDESAYSLDARARSWLEVNCGYCHRGAESALTGTWDGRARTPLGDCSLVRMPAADNGGSTNNLLLVPGDSAHSIIWNRLAAANGFTRMPPIGTSEVDPAGVQLIASWIAQELPSWRSYDEWRTAVFGGTNAPGSGPDDDPDGDHVSNRAEFLAGTSPTNAASAWAAAAALTNGEIELAFELFNRAVVVESSTNLVDWSAWPVPGNDALPLASGTVVRLRGPAPTNGAAFHRLRIGER